MSCSVFEPIMRVIKIRIYRPTHRFRCLFLDLYPIGGTNVPAPWKSVNYHPWAADRWSRLFIRKILSGKGIGSFPFQKVTLTLFISPNLITNVIDISDVTMRAMASQITSLTTVYSIVYSGTYQRKHQSSASLTFVRGIRRWPVNSLHKGPVTRKMMKIGWRHHVTLIWCHFDGTSSFQMANTCQRISKFLLMEELNAEYVTHGQTRGKLLRFVFEIHVEHVFSYPSFYMVS